MTALIQFAELVTLTLFAFSIALLAGWLMLRRIIGVMSGCLAGAPARRQGLIEFRLRPRA